VPVARAECHALSGPDPALPVPDVGGLLPRARGLFKNDDDVYTAINDITNQLRPLVQTFLEDFCSQRHFDIWIPPATVDSTTRQFYERLRIPSTKKTAGKGPTLLLHNLGKEPNVYADKLFAISRNR
jgi:hypothetical protein